MRAWRQFALRHRATPTLTDNDNQRMAEDMGNGQMYPIVGGVGNGVTEEAPGQGLNWVQQPFNLLAMWVERVQKDPPWACHEEVPPGFGLRAGKHSNTADDAAEVRYLPSQARINGRCLRC